MRLKDRIAIVVGAGQSPGEGIGNGRATALTFAREGAKVLCVDHDLGSAQQTVDMIGAKGGTALAFKADATRNTELEAMVAEAHGRWGRIDILHNNVGVSLAGGDAELLDLTEEALDRCAQRAPPLLRRWPPLGLSCVFQCLRRRFAEKQPVTLGKITEVPESTGQRTRLDTDLAGRELLFGEFR